MLSAVWLASCAPGVSAETLRAVIAVESGGNPLALGINGPLQLVREPKNADEATQAALAVLSAGYSVDLGLMQVNSSNLEGLGVTLEEMFEPCKNVGAGARVLEEAYARAVAVHGEGQRALRAALSAYNTGDLEQGILNGYVARYGIAPPDEEPVQRQLAEDPFTSETRVFTTRREAMDNKRDPETKQVPLVTRDLSALGTPGVEVEVEREMAEEMGAFTETALSAEEAWEANVDLAKEDADGAH